MKRRNYSGTSAAAKCPVLWKLESSTVFTEYTSQCLTTRRGARLTRRLLIEPGAKRICLITWVTSVPNEAREFRPLQAEEIALAFNGEGVDYLFIGKSGAILLGYPGTTQDVDIFPARSPENGRKIVAALRQIGFPIEASLEQQVIGAKPQDKHFSSWRLCALTLRDQACASLLAQASASRI